MDAVGGLNRTFLDFPSSLKNMSNTLEFMTHVYTMKSYKFHMDYFVL